MRVEVVDEGAPAWDAFLADVEHDVYHLPGYAALSAGMEPAGSHATPHAVIVVDGERGMLLPILLRQVSNAQGARDATSPYGYPGPLFRGAADQAFLADASAALVAHLADENVVSLFVRTHPLLNPDVDGLAAVGSIVEHGQTVSIDLTASTDELWGATRPGHRSDVKLAIQRGARAFLDESWTHESAFVRLYQATMARLEANHGYQFGADYVRSLRAVLGPRLHLGVVEVDGHIAAAGLFTEACGIVQYHLSGSDPAFARLAPTKLMLHHVREEMKRRNDRVMHLGGGVAAADDSLFRFKAGFSNRRQPFRTWRVIVDPERYAALSGAVDPSADPADTSGFFPIYRRDPR
jgi:hypothetical protein